MNIDDLDNETRKKMEELQKITREKDGAQDYAKAQTDKGLIYYNNDQFQESYQAFDNIRKTDSLIRYMMAQFGMGALLIKDDKLDEALVIWNNLRGLGNSLNAAQLKFEIGSVLVGNTFEKYDEAKQFFIETLEYYPYESYCYKKICNLLANKEYKIIGENVLQLLEKTLKIVNVLKIDFGQDADDKKSPERKLAHYTNTTISNVLLEIDEENTLPSSFRLNTINNVNDPSEGHLLINYLKDTQENSFYAPDFDKNLHAFISCFTFNHDSLNQFRLYGKEAEKEASGVSLVFGKEFFQLESALGGLSFLSLDNNVQNTNGVISHLEVDEESSMRGSNNRISKQPVMRCVYIDPTSNYVQLAQRNRITFFREYGSDAFQLEGIETSKAEYEWKKYKNYIDTKTEAFNDAFIDLKNIYKSIMKEKTKFNKDSFELLDDVDLLTNEILLPLKYLIKHSAFQEEQECRMVYVTSIKAPEVKMVDKRFLFVEYEGKVKENLDKVYIAPAATKYQLYLSWLLRDKDVKIELSNNPYRQT